MTKILQNTPPAMIGGNLVQLDEKNQIHVTNKKGKTKVLTHDQFQRQMEANQDKLLSGQDFEFKKPMSPAKKLFLTLAGAGSLAAAFIYPKNIAEFFKALSKSASGLKISKEADDLKEVVNELQETLKNPEKVKEKTTTTLQAGAEKIGEAAGTAVSKALTFIDFLKGFGRKA